MCDGMVYNMNRFEQQNEKTSNLGLHIGTNRFYSDRRRLEASDFEFKNKRNCIIHVTKTKALITFRVTAQLICAFCFRICRFMDCVFSDVAAHLLYSNPK